MLQTIIFTRTVSFNIKEYGYWHNDVTIAYKSEDLCKSS